MADDIDEQVGKVLRGLGNPSPPLRLLDVRELLKLDRQYFTTDDDGFLREIVSRLKISGKQIIERPALLFDVVKKFDLRALYLPDNKRILLDKYQPELKHRWMEAHEIGHAIVPWHSGMMLGDNKITLSPACHAKMEAEANYAAGRLLFLSSHFDNNAEDTEPSISTIRRLHSFYENTLTTTLWRYVEGSHLTLPMAGMISGHPHVSRRPKDFNPLDPCDYFIQSPAFSNRFATMSDRVIFQKISSYCGAQRGGPLGEAEIILPDDNGDSHLFRFETFFNGFSALTLAVYLRPKNILVNI